MRNSKSSQTGRARSTEAQIAPYPLAALSSALWAVSVPNLDYTLPAAAWIALSALLSALYNQSPIRALKIGFLTGALYNLITYSWVYNSITTYGGASTLVGLIAVGALSGYLSLYLACFALLFALIAKRFGYFRAHIIAPFLLITIDSARANFPQLQFPWLTLAESQYQNLSINAISSIAGAHGLTFLIVVFNCAISAIFVALFFSRLPSRKRMKILALSSVSALVAIGAPLLYSSMGNPESDSSESVRIALIQTNIDQKLKWKTRLQNQHLRNLFTMTSELAPESPDLIVWPESALPYFFGSDERRDRGVLALARRLDSTILFGSLRRPKQESIGSKEFYNSAWLISPNGAARWHDKVNLVPFGEYVPYKRLLFFVDKLAAVSGQIAPGLEGAPFIAPPFRITPAICFEIAFAEHIRRLSVKARSNLIVTLTNDSWFGRSKASEQALAIAVSRAIENQIPLARAAQSGISAIIDSDGAILRRSELFEKTILSDTISIRVGASPSIYQKFGYLFEYLAIFVALGAIAFSLAPQRATIE